MHRIKSGLFYENSTELDEVVKSPDTTENGSVSRDKHKISGRVNFKFLQYLLEIRNNPGSQT